MTYEPYGTLRVRHSNAKAMGAAEVFSLYHMSRKYWKNESCRMFSN